MRNVPLTKETCILFSATRLPLVRKGFFKLLGFSFNSFFDREIFRDGREIDVVQPRGSIAVATSEGLVSRGKYTLNVNILMLRAGNSSTRTLLT